jgi:hypothetical protein
MAKVPKSDLDETTVEIARRMLNTPPKPYNEMKVKKTARRESLICADDAGPIAKAKRLAADDDVELLVWRTPCHPTEGHDEVSAVFPAWRGRAEGEGEMKSAARVWTPYEDERIRVLASSGASPATIAAQLKRSDSAVRKRAARLKIVVAKQKAKGK